VRDVAAIIRPQVDAKGLALSLMIPAAGDPDADECVVWADRDKLTQALFNLLANAIEFTPQRRPTVHRDRSSSN